ncbi:MAG: hypothetical protein PHX74_08915 [Candidatus Sumerlaeales bacterium]|nr:hypothetical protein [Candidatus Sumerlaeales bacterium]
MNTPNHLFRALFVFALLLNIATPIIGFMCFSDHADAMDLRDQLGMASMTVPVIAALLTILAWIVSMKHGNEKRSMVATALLFVTATLGCGIFSILFSDHSDEPFYIIAVGVATILIPTIILLLEWLIATTSARIGTALRVANKPGAATIALNIALALRPDNKQARFLLAMMLTKNKKYEKAMPLLKSFYDAKVDNTDFLQALYESSTITGEKMLQMEVGEKLESIAPDTNRFDELLVLWLDNNEHDKALQKLEALSQEEQGPYLDVLFHLKDEKNEEEECLNIADRMAAIENAPYETTQEILKDFSNRHPKNLGALERLRNLGEKRKRQDEVINAIEKILVLNPQNEISRRILIDNCRANDQLSDVIAQLNILAQLGQANMSDYLELAQWHFESNRTQQALDTIAKIPEEQQRIPEIIIFKMTCLNALNRREEAIAVGKTVGEAGENIASKFAIAPHLAVPDAYKKIRMLTTEISTKETLAELNQLRNELCNNPKDIQLHFRVITLLCRAEMFTEAVIAYDDILAMDATLESKVLEHLNEQMENYPNNTTLSNYLIDLCERRRDWRKMFETYKTLTRTSVTPNVIMAQGCKRILKNTPAFAAPIDEIMKFAGETGTVTEEECLQYLDKFYEAGGMREPKRTMAEFRIAAKLPQSARALELASKIVADNANDLDLLKLAASIYEEHHIFDKAIEITTTLVKNEGKEPATNKTILRLKDKWRDDKIADTKKQMENDPNNPVLLDVYGDLMHEANRRNEALAAYQKASQKHSPLADVYRAKYAYEMLLKGPSFYSEAQLAFKSAELTPEQDAEIQDSIKNIFYRSAKLVRSENQWDFALELLKRIFRVDASYLNTVSQIDEIEGLIRSKRKY